MSERTLFLAWQDKRSRQWFPVGRLDADAGNAAYRFRYVGGAERAQQWVGFPGLLEFPDLHGDYRSRELFPIFQNRVMNRKRPDFADYVRRLDLPDDADSIAILSANGGRRQTDSYEVFPKIEPDADGRLQWRFFLHGSRHVSVEDRQRIERLHPGEPLSLIPDHNNPATDLAVKIRTKDDGMIGWAPDYLARDLAAAKATDFQAEVVRVNPLSTPWNHRVLIEVQGRLTDHEPMSGDDFEPLAP